MRSEGEVLEEYEARVDEFPVMNTRNPEHGKLRAFMESVKVGKHMQTIVSLGWVLEKDDEAISEDLLEAMKWYHRENPSIIKAYMEEK